MTAGTGARPAQAVPSPRPGTREGPRTLRRDRWWLRPALTAAVLTAFVVYATWAAFVGDDYWAPPYLSPFYSPCVVASCEEGARHAGLVGQWWRLSPALVILVFPLGMRLTCYYYRGAYYRAFWQSPPACSVREPHRRYTGESRFPLVLQNAHRYFFYAALVFTVLLTADAVLAFRNSDLEWFHMGLGTVVLTLNAVLLWLYTLSCHSCRHIVGGRINNFSAHPWRYRFWTWVSRLNARHAEYAWASLVVVALADVYVRLVATGVITDPRFF